ncbi:MAG: hypothetical protein C0169_00070 [Thermodesulfobacterium geofontis]|uniref:Zinc ABC transporter substrate-binding protein n=1 Tax=Thermodesulfobacterium geofontis TaxID=1295609 RepID=A0A2N7QGY4_9BACT|nr:MAG: hypothetical protein C0169_00070 [Thermodesulfobacterium geofontis]
MKKIKFFWIFIIFGLILFFKSHLYALEIVVSNQALEKIVKEIISGHKIYQLQSEKEDFHFYEPTLYQWQKIKTADLVIIVGSEAWAKRVYELRKNKETISLARGETKFLDPHLWFDLERVKILAKELSEYISKKDPSKKELYRTRAFLFLKSIENIQKNYQKLRFCKYKEIYILGHPVFGYLLKNSGIKEITLLKGYHKEGEASIKTVSEMIERLKSRKRKIVFLTDPEFERYKKFFEKEGIKVIKLWSGGTYYIPGSYTELLKYNLKNIELALECN